MLDVGLRDWCTQTLSRVAETIKNFAVIYLVDITEVPYFNTMYELYDPCTVMFFFRNKQIQIDLGTGNNNKINWAMTDKQEFIDIVDVVYRCAYYAFATSLAYLHKYPPLCMLQRDCAEYAVTWCFFPKTG